MQVKADNNHIETNRNSWNNLIDIHLNSDFYDVEGFLQGTTSLNSIELELLGNLEGKRILHLQCHFGQDSIALSRLGAKVTGVDLSDKAIESARQLASDAQEDVTFICCDIYDLPNLLTEQFDLVFTSYGTIGWLPDLKAWAKIISKFLTANGRFVFVEFHPVVWMFDDNFERIEYAYFNTGPIIESYSGTYANKNAEITQSYVMWNHSISEVMNTLIKEELRIDSFEEFDYSPYNCFNNTVEIAPKKFRIKQLDNKIPMVYSIVATKI